MSCTQNFRVKSIRTFFVKKKFDEDKKLPKDLCMQHLLRSRKLVLARNKLFLQCWW